MTITNLTVWLCDRCHAEHKTEGDPSWQPNDWARILSLSPPKASHEVAEHLVHLCRPCRTDLALWLRYAPVEADR